MFKMFDVGRKKKLDFFLIKLLKTDFQGKKEKNTENRQINHELFKVKIKLNKDFKK